MENQENSKLQPVNNGSEEERRKISEVPDDNLDRHEAEHDLDSLEPQ